MELPEKIAGLDARTLRGMFKSLVDRETEAEWRDGKPWVEDRRVTSHLIETELQVPADESRRIQSELVAEGWIDPDKFTPTRKGMALAQHIDRPKLVRSDAEAILDRVLEWADRTNADSETRIKLKAIHLFGSLARGAPEVSDIDLFVEFSTMDLDMDLQPEDLAREDELCAELADISEYLSLSSVFDRMSMDDVPMRLVFPRQT